MLLYLLLPASIVEYVHSWAGSELAAYQSIMLGKTAEEPFNRWQMPFNQSLLYREKARSMFYHGFNGYMKHAFPLDELDPIGCTGRGPDLVDPGNININDVLGNYSLTLVDSLDTLAVLGDKVTFAESIRLVVQEVDFDQPHSVNLFEATIRVLGALLSAHQLITERPFGKLVESYENEVLDKAVDLAERLLGAFDVEGFLLPRPRVRLDGGAVHTSNTTDTTAASVTSLVLEFGTLSELTGNPKYLDLARQASDRAWELRSNVTGLFPAGVDAETGEVTNAMSGTGAGIDSALEYLLKSHVMFGREIDLSRFTEAMAATRKYQRMGRKNCFSGEGSVPFFANVDYHSGNLHNHWIDALSAFLPGLLTLSGDIEEAVCLHFLYFSIWRMFDAMPERYNWKQLDAEVLFYPLRPELIESTYHLYRATKSPFYLHAGAEILDALNRNVRTECGYATMHSVKTRQLEDRMESFFLAETVKYLYLLFDEENALHKEDGWIFTTEGHPLKAHRSRTGESGLACRGDNGTTNPICPGQCFRYTREHESLPMPVEYMRQTEQALGLRLS